MLEIVAVVVNMNVWTRLKLGEGAMPSVVDSLAAPDPTAACHPLDQWRAGLSSPAALPHPAGGLRRTTRMRGVLCESFVAACGVARVGKTAGHVDGHVGHACVQALAKDGRMRGPPSAGERQSHR